MLIDRLHPLFLNILNAFKRNFDHIMDVVGEEKWAPPPPNSFNLEAMLILQQGPLQQLSPLHDTGFRQLKSLNVR